MNTIEKQIIQETKGLPPKIMNEILDFIQFLKEKKLKNNSTRTQTDSLNTELSLLDRNELNHLEEEFKNYKELYPYEK